MEDATEPLADLAYRRIKAAVMEGALAPGYQVSEQQIAAHLGMSRTPVHQAVARLEQEQWLSLAPKRGVVIARMEPADVVDLYEALMSLEGTAVMRLASTPGPLDPRVAAALEAACAEGDRALAAGDVSAWARADDDFHSALVEGCGNRRLARLAAVPREHAHRACLLTLRLRPLPEESAVEHRAIVQALFDRDGPGARAALEAHRTRALGSMRPVLEALADAGNSWMQPCMR